MNYDLHSLGWGNFQQLCETILREVLGQTFQSFTATNDAGRDGAFYGSWKPNKNELFTGSFTVQCKFSAKCGANLQPHMLSEELIKAKRLASKGLAQNYLLFTNMMVTGVTEEKIKESFVDIRGIKTCTVYHGGWITGIIKENKRLRALVPRLYGLGDLSEILDERVYEQTKALLDSWGDGLERFVITDSYRKSFNALSKKNFVFLLGNPGSGKSSIAAALSIAAGDSWQSRSMKIERASDFSQHWNSETQDQLFWVDDVFGSTQYERDKTLQWNEILPKLFAAAKRDTRIIFTSRSYIYKAAVEDLKESAFPLMTESQVVIEVEKLKKFEREQILYNHLRLGNQPRKFRTAIKPYLSEVAAHPKFMPETARRLGNKAFTKELKVSKRSIINFVEKTEQYLKEVILKLGDQNKSALAIIFLRGGELRAPLDLLTEEEHALNVMNSSVGKMKKSLQSLEGSLVAREVTEGVNTYHFKHPTIRDAFGSVIANDPVLLDVFLRGSRPERLIQEVTCGRVRLQGVKVVVPQDRFHIVLARLRELACYSNGKRKVASFLARRCSKSFLKYFLKENEGFLDDIDLGHWIVWSDEAALFAKLHSYRLLPNFYRETYMYMAEEAMMDNVQWRFMRNDKLRAIYSADELSELRRKIRRRLTMTRLKAETDAWYHAWRNQPGKDPDEHFWYWQYELSSFMDEFADEPRMFNRFWKTHEKVNLLCSRLRKKWEKREKEVIDDEVIETYSERSIFDDVDL